MQKYSEWQYTIVKDEFSLYFPEGDYDIKTLADWYRIVPTKGEEIAYYNDNIELVKQHFEKFSTSNDVNTKVMNDLHSNSILYVRCMAIYDKEGTMVGFAAQQYLNGSPAFKKFLYFNEFDTEEYCFAV